MSGAWDILGVLPSAERSAIRRAYAAKLRTTNPEDDPEGFRALRQAYEFALEMCDRQAVWAVAEEALPDVPSELTPAVTVVAGPTAQAATADTPAAPSGFAAPMRPFHDLQHMISTPESYDADAIRARMAELLAVPEMENVDFRGDMEARIAELIAQGMPRSDALVAPALNYFGWGQLEPHAHRVPFAESVHRRAWDLDFLADIERRGRSEFQALRELQRSAPDLWRSIWLRLDVDRMSELKDFIERVREHRPSLMHNLNADTFAWWSSFFRRPQMTMPGLLMWCIAGFILSYASVFWVGDSIGLDYGPLLYIAIGFAASVAAALVYYYGIAWPRSFMACAMEMAGADMGAARLAPAALVLPWFAVALPGDWWSLLIVAPLALGIALWSLATGERDTREGGWGWHARALLIQAYLFLWWLLMLLSPSEMPPPHLTIAVAAASVASFAGAETLLHAWTIDCPPWLRVAGLAILAALVVATGAMFGLVGDRPELAPLIAAGVAVAVNVHRTMAYGLSDHPGVSKLRHLVMWFGAMVVFGLLANGSSIPLVVRGGALLLLGVSFVLVVSLADDIRAVIRSRQSGRQTEQHSL